MPRGINLRFSGISDDSRHVRKGDIFFAIRGAKFDGRKFIDEAVKKGAVAVVAGKDFKVKIEGAKVIRVADPRKMLAQTASDFYGNPSEKVRVIGVTGTNGKTTITYLLEEVFRSAGQKAGIIGTIAHRWADKVIEAKNTTPGSIELARLLSEMASAGVHYCAMEVSSHSLDQGRTAGIDFKAAIFTNITGEHLDYHKTFENYLKAKAVLFSGLNPTGLAVLNSDDPNCGKIKKKTKARVLTYGIKNKADITAEEIKFGLNKTEFLVRAKRWGAFGLTSPLIGVFNVYNILAVTACALDEGISIEAIKKAVADFRGAEGRLEAVRANRDFKIFVDYAHTDNALENVLKALRHLVKNRLIVVFGCGGDRDKFKRPRMGAVSSKLADYVVITSDNPRGEEPSAITRQIEKGIGKGFRSYEIILDRYEAIKKAIEIAGPRDIVLIAGKGHEKYQIIGDKALPFCDREVVERVIARRRGAPTKQSPEIASLAKARSQ